ncbi:saccharopine dehydrogenase-like oxidoreductase [Anastrepha obliqua]|uniref:saccharopine dehydrogenase-like oxidoreductase n=1 Tax=Anastrepha obliqua TaxID=95512 RepID=UPI0024097B55|nr:saccharopine dehydrogenase-like oxidoreductase [Anastrepha obliqua]
MSFSNEASNSRVLSEDKLVKKQSTWKDITRRRLDVIIFGATGCAGRFTVREAVRALKSYSWGVAGRNKQKMRDLLQDIGIQSRKNLSKIPIAVANLKQKRSLYKLARKCRVLINCVGPYESYSENVVKACILAKTHYIDLCIESHFMDYIHYKFDKLAKKRGVYVIMSCGLQSLPADVGINYMRNHFNGTINSIDAYMEFWTNKPWVFGSIMNVWASFILGNSNMRRFRRKLLPKMNPVAPCRSIINEPNVVQGFGIPAPTVDEDIVDRTQLYFLEEKDLRPIQYHNYIVFSNPAIALLLVCWYYIILIFSQLSWTRRLLLKCPRIFSFGLFSFGPNEDNADEIFFQITFKAEGWDQSTKLIRNTFADSPNKVVVGSVSGTCPFYGVASVCLLVGAITILNEHSKLPHRGGVYTPGAAFEKTKIIKELQKYEHGLYFEILSTNRVDKSC